MIRVGVFFAVSCTAALSSGAAVGSESDLRAAIARRDRLVQLAPGTITLQKGIEIPTGFAEIEIRGDSKGSTLRLSPDFSDRAVILARGVSRLRLRSFAIAGVRKDMQTDKYLPPSNIPFWSYYRQNGVLIVESRDVEIEQVSVREVLGFAMIVSSSTNVSIASAQVEDCGSLNASGRNNTSGGILIEEGSSNFSVRQSKVRRVVGNGIWTHSNYTSRRLANGLISGNVVEDVARDAIQVGHATNVRVEKNTGSRIGFPVKWVDAEGQGTPVALDTAGNVDQSFYQDNTFTEVNGQCIDLDGFHHGEVRNNSCVNNHPLSDYPNSHYGIVFGNTNPDMSPESVLVTRNTISGFAYGGIFVIGSKNTITENHLLRINQAHCTGDMTPARCRYAPEEPGMLRSGVYLGKFGGRPAATSDNRIYGNVVSGFGMDRWCIGAAPGVKPEANEIKDNRCSASND